MVLNVVLNLVLSSSLFNLSLHQNFTFLRFLFIIVNNKKQQSKRRGTGHPSALSGLLWPWLGTFIFSFLGGLKSKSLILDSFNGAEAATGVVL